MSNHTPGAHPGDPTPDRASKRTLFRVLGVLFMGTAVGLIGWSIYDFSQAWNDPSFGAEPDKFWLFFVAMPFFLLGAVFLNLGFSGATAKYMASEYSPAIQSVARDIGLRDEPSPARGSGPYCRSCGRQNDADARFCDSCGTSMSV